MRKTVEIHDVAHRRQADAMPRPTPARPGERAAHLLGIGVAVPEICLPQPEAERRYAALLNLEGETRERWRRIIAGSGIEQRFLCAPVERFFSMTTAERMAAYEQLAPPLGEQAARRALQASGAGAGAITDLVVVSCTGFAAPGLDVALVERLGLPRTTRRTVVGFQGCFGGIVGLRQAAATCLADPRAVALVVCVELCSLHVRDDDRADNLVASALFGDGAAAAVVGGADAISTGDPQSPAAPLGTLSLGASLLIEEGRDWMTWRVTDEGFAMTLTRDVPVALRRRLASFVREHDGRRPETFAVHPGGPGILDAVDTALALRGGSGIDAARRVLCKYSNMSSGTVLAVLHEVVRADARRPVMLLAFGPGLSVEALRLEA